MYKSGTTLLRSMLGQHSKSFSGLETYWFDLYHDQTTDIRILNRIVEFFNSDLISITKIYEKCNHPTDFLENFMSEFTNEKDYLFWIEKTPKNICYYQDIFSYWGESAFLIHIIRDPRDIFASLKKAKKWNTFDEFFSRWSLVINARKNILSSKQQFKNFIEIYYDDLITDPSNEMKKIINLIDVPFEDSICDYQGSDNEFNIVKNVTGKSSSTLESLKKPLNSNSNQIWKSILDDNDLRNLKVYAKKYNLLDDYEGLCRG